MTDRPTDTPIDIAPSILPADFSRLGDEVRRLADSGADRIHWDIMDGVFVPNFTMGPEFIGSCRELTDCHFEAHLMVVQPDRLLDRYVEAGCDTVIVHAEACEHLHRVVGSLRDAGVAPGVSINPGTPPEAIRYVLDLVDLVLVMTVNPGFGGQRYLASMEPKVATIRQWVRDGGHDVRIEVDGGISTSTVAAPVRAGADVLVSGSALFNHPEGLGPAIAELRAAALAAGRATGVA